MENIEPKQLSAQARANKKYRENNKDKINAQRRNYYLNRKMKDPSFMEYKRNKAKEYYNKKKQGLKQLEPIIEETKEPEEQIKEELEPIIEIPIIDETIQEKKKRKYNKKTKNI
jgi:serine/threonine protein kinase HipA of HipAB toxin-antitoxin module